MVAGAVLVRLSEVAERDRPIDGRHDVGEPDVFWPAGQDVPATDAAFRLHETGPFQRQENLFQVRLRQRCSIGDVTNRCGALLVRVQCE